jgi:phage tail sheath protein FI
VKSRLRRWKSSTRAWCWISSGRCAIPTYLTPGIYRTTPAPPPPPLTLVRTDIAGFVGFAERGPLPEDFAPGVDAALVARRLTGWAEYQAAFGSFLANGYLAYAVRAFFENGGDTCYVVRVAATATAQIPLDHQAIAASVVLPAGPVQAAGTLAGPGGTYTVKITLTPPLTPDALIGNMVTISHSGLSHTAIVQGTLADGSFLLSATLDAQFAAGDAVTLYPTAATITARSRGFWGNRIRLQFTQLDAGAFGLAVTVDLGPDTMPREQEFYRRLVLDPTKPNDAAATLAAQSNLITLQSNGAPISFDPAGPLGGRVVYLEGGRDGLADVSLSDFSGSTTNRRGLRLLEEIDEVAIIAIPDAVLTIAPPLRAKPVELPPCTPPPAHSSPVLPPDPTAVPKTLSDGDRSTLQMLMIEQCERLNYRVALIDPPSGLQPDTMSLWPAQPAQGLINRSARFAALYYPWLRVPDPLGVEGPNRTVPPSGHVAGAYAQVDLSVGVQHPPANVALVSAANIAQDISDLQQGPLNTANVNAIRAFRGRGIRIWGARSLAADDAWRFIHVRRLMSAIEETVQRSSRWAIFEVNDTTLRKTLTHSLNVLLEGIWAKGGLQGSAPDQGFYVKCDDTNNPQSVIDAGQVICKVGVAIAAPMEFLVFEIRQDVTGGVVVES